MYFVLLAIFSINFEALTATDRTVSFDYMKFINKARSKKIVQIIFRMMLAKVPVFNHEEQ